MDLTPTGIARILTKDITLEGIHNRYAKHFWRIDRAIENFNGLKVQIDAGELPSSMIKDERDLLNFIRFLIIYYDLSIISLWQTDKFSNPHVMPQDRFQKLNPEYLIPNHVMEKLYLGYSLCLTPRFSYGTGSQNHFIIKEMEEVLASGRVILKPRRANLIEVVSSDGSRIWGDFPIGPYAWWIECEKHELGIRSFCSSNSTHEQSIFRLTLPFLADIPFKILIEIIEDEEDTLYELRNELRQIVDGNEEARERPKEFIRDNIFPRIHAMNVKYRKLMERRSIRKTASLGSAIISLSSLTSNFGLSSAATGAGGTYSAILEKDEFEKSKAEIDPAMRIFWRLNRYNTTK